MPATPIANLEMTIGLPLKAVAHQLTKIETNLRFLDARAGDFASELDNGRLPRSIAGQFDHIHALLQSIRCMVSNIEADIRGDDGEIAAVSKPRPDLED
jgi:hypothetical protein